MNKRAFQSLWALLSLLLMAGCSALRIDVDVYKGPMLNEPDTQALQLVSMTIAAKALLESEQTNLENRCKSNKGADCAQNKVLLRQLIDLYEDVAYADLARTLEEQGRNLRRYAIKADELDQLRKRLFKDSRTLLASMKSSPDEAGKKDKLDALKLATARLVFGETNTDSRKESSGKPVLVLFRDLKGAGPSQENALEDLIAFLKDSANRQELVNLLFGKEQVPASPSASERTRMADRKNADVLLLRLAELSAERWRILEEIYAALLNSSELQQILEAPSGQGQSKLPEIAGAYFSEATQLRTMACGLELARRSSDTSTRQTAALFDDAVKANTERSLFLPRAERRSELWSTADYAEANQDFKRVLRSSPRVTLELMRALQKVVIQAAPGEVQACNSLSNPSGIASRYNLLSDMESTYSMASRKHGLVYGISLDAETSRGRLETARTRLLSAQSSLGLSADRDVNGISSLAKAVSQTNPENKSQDAKRAQEEAYAHFRAAVVSLGEKMRFLSVNWWLVDSDGQKVASNDPRDSEFKTLLEALGNAMISQADESIARARFKAEDGPRAKLEKQSLEQVFRQSPASIMSQLKAFLSSAQLEAQTRQDAAKAQTDETAEASKKLSEEIAKAQKLQEPAKKAYDAEEGNRTAALGALEVLGYPSAAGTKTLKPSFAKATAKPQELSANKKRTQDWVASDTEKKTRAALALKLATWLDGRLVDEGRVNEASEGYARLKSAKAFLLTVKEEGEPDLPAAQLESLRGLAYRMTEQADAVLDPKKKALDALDKTLADKQKELAALKAKQPKADAPDSLEGAELALALIERHGATFLQGQPQQSHVDEPSAFLNAFAAFVQASETANGKKPDAKLPDAFKAMGAFTPVGFGTPGIKSGDEPKKVIDALLVALRHRYVQAVVTSGKDSIAARHLLQGIQEAQRQRGDMAYLRPAAYYLRSIHSTILSQGEPSVRWRNMLDDTFAKSPPILGTHLQNSRDSNDELVQRIDQTFWQSINTVKLNASGRSNFVVVKDDVGNWYVKAYGSDPSKMIQSAKNLLLFNIGAGIDQDLLRLNELRKKRDGMTGASQSDVASVDSQIQAAQLKSDNGGQALGSVVAKLQAQYAKDLEEQRSSLIKAIKAETVRTTLREKWGGIVMPGEGNATLFKDQVDAILEASPTFQTLVDQEFADPGSDEERSKQIRDILAKVKVWLGELKAQVDAAGLDSAAKLKLDAKKKELVDLEKAEKDLEEAFSKDDGNTAQTTADYRQAIGKAATARKEAKVLESTLTDIRAKLAEAKAMAGSVVFDGFIKSAVDKRLKSIKTTETTVLTVSEVMASASTGQ